VPTIPITTTTPDSPAEDSAISSSDGGNTVIYVVTAIVCVVALGILVSVSMIVLYIFKKKHAHQQRMQHQIDGMLGSPQSPRKSQSLPTEYFLQNNDTLTDIEVCCVNSLVVAFTEFSLNIRRFGNAWVEGRLVRCTWLFGRALQW
jgi:hypothetical protein